MPMNELLARIIDAHGGIDCWNQYERVEATIVSGGGFFRLKGFPQDSTPRRMTAWLRREERGNLAVLQPSVRRLKAERNMPLKCPEAFCEFDGQPAKLLIG